MDNLVKDILGSIEGIDKITIKENDQTTTLYDAENADDQGEYKHLNSIEQVILAKKLIFLLNRINILKNDKRLAAKEFNRKIDNLQQMIMLYSDAIDEGMMKQEAWESVKETISFE
ncbi:MAG: hypothetical protein L3V56_03670 [Candidatus Magnetoovum sp. WYHC-5]|nr:hypothetical protein [Candidatus Magnetoovum sp. WYHC-5]